MTEPTDTAQPKHNRTSLILIGVILIGVGVLFTLPFKCKPPAPVGVIHNPIDSIANVAQRRGDSLLASAHVIDSLQKLLRTSTGQTIIRTTKWIEVYHTDTNLLHRLEACDSISDGFEELAVNFTTMDSIHQHTEADLRLRGDILSVAIDTARNYSLAQTTTINDLNTKLAKKDRKLARNRRIALVEAGLITVATALIYEHLAKKAHLL